MRTEQEIREAIAKCEKANCELAMWYVLATPPIPSTRKIPNLPECWMGGKCDPNECTTKATLEWVLGKEFKI